MRKQLLLIIALCLHLAARGQTVPDALDLSWLPQPTQAKALRYWIDDDTGNIQTSDILNGRYTVDASSLIEGLHTIHFQIIDNEEKVAAPYSGIFLKMDSRLSASEASTLRYWFDDDTNVSTCSANVGTQLLDVSALLDGLHTLHYQVVDTEGKASYIASNIFLKMQNTVSSSTASTLRYWFDDNTNVSTCNANVGTQLLDASALLDGLHTLHYQVVDTEGKASYIASNIFLKMGTMAETGAVKAEKLVYWFDDEQTTTTIDMLSGIMTLDASKLLDGLHTVHYMVVCNDGSVTSAYSSIFLRMNLDILSTTAQSLRYWFDDESTITTTEITQGTQMLDASHLLDGLHTVHYQIVDNSGAVTSPYSSIFLKMAERDETVATAQSLRYWFNDDKEVRTTTVAGGTQIIDVSDLLAGLHTLHYQLIDSNGDVSSPTSRIFIKNFDKAIADGENRVTKYQYWLNMNSEAMQTVELDGVANPYTLISLLPMQKEPILSSQFHFEVTNDVPTIYAKNTLHVRFYDAQNYFTDGQKPFVDYSVKQEVTDAEWLESGVIATTEKPAENTIKWYCLEAEPGDSLQFKLDRAATIQLFAPSGKEVHTASGSEVVQWNGLHVRESGTYYLALHDVTAQNCYSLNVDYLHIDKYAVLSYTPSDLGVLPGAQVIQLNGNGFDKLTAATLRLGERQVTAEKIYSDEKSEAELLFVLQGNEDKGVYDLVLGFEDDGVSDELIVTGAITLSIPDFSDFKIEITDPRSVASPYPVSVSITNKGNLTYSDIPFFMAYDNVDKIKDICFIDFEVEADKSLVNEGLKFTYDIDNFKGKGIKAKMIPTFIPILRPGETMTIKLGFRADSHATYNVYAWAGTPWSLYAYETMSAIQSLAASGTGFTGGGASGSGGGGTGGSGAGGSGGSSSGSGGGGTGGSDAGGSGGSSSGSGGGEAGDGIIIILPGGGAGGNGSGGVGTSCMPDPCDIAGFFGDLQECLCGTAVGLGTILGGIQLALLNRHNKAQREQLAESGLYDNPYENFRNHPLPHPGDIFWNWASHCLLGKAGQAASAFNDAMEMIGGDPCPDPSSHNCNQYNPGDPNDIFGYMAESGSLYMKAGTTDVYYAIEFENDSKIANASAHTIIVKDTIDTNRFDLSSFAAKSVKIGDKIMELDGRKNFSSLTMDLRPAVDVIAQVSLSLDEKKGIATWTIESLDPMSLEPTEDAMQGVLPVNYNGMGQGELIFDIKLKPGMVEGESVSNRAAIKFDQEEVIVTPTWTNTVDATMPESKIVEVTMASDTTICLKIEAYDELSKPWKYDLFVQENTDGIWHKKAVNIPVDSLLQVRINEGINYGFYVVVTDSAGNVEQKDAEREFTFEIFGSQVDTNTMLELAEGWNWVSHNQNEALILDGLKSSAIRMVGQTEELFKDSRFGWMGDLEELQPTQMYKLQMAEATNIQMSGRLYNAGFRSIPLYQGWNWIGYPVANVMTPAEAMAKLEAEEGDFIIGQDGMATYTDGQWTGTLTELTPGQGYMYRSTSYKNLFYNATAQASSRQMAPRRAAAESWSVDKRKYPNVMGVVAVLSQDGHTAEAEEWLVAAFCGDECRGVAKTVGGDVLMMNVYGNGAEPIAFYAMNRETEEIMLAEETEEFRTDVLGTMQHPYELHIGMTTGIKTYDNGQKTVDNFVYDLQGRRIGDKLSTINARLKKGVYIVTDGKKTKAQKIVRQ